MPSFRRRRITSGMPLESQVLEIDFDRDDYEDEG
jgi:hypothetical protein